MGNRTWALLGLAVVAAVALGAWTVTRAQAWSEAADRQDRADEVLAVATAHQQRLDARLLDAEQNLAGAEAAVRDQRRYFIPAVLTAVTRVQASATETVCGQARTATRDGTALPDPQAALDRAVADAASRPSLAGLDEWERFLQPGEVQAEIDACAADEAALIEAERQAAAAEAARLDRNPPCDPSQLTINSPTRGTYCVND